VLRPPRERCAHAQRATTSAKKQSNGKAPIVVVENDDDDEEQVDSQELAAAARANEEEDEDDIRVPMPCRPPISSILFRSALIRSRPPRSNHLFTGHEDAHRAE
jgi:hypothetical protein